jgi:hypothetical protein
MSGFALFKRDTKIGGWKSSCWKISYWKISYWKIREVLQ